MQTNARLHVLNFAGFYRERFAPLTAQNIYVQWFLAHKVVDAMWFMQTRLLLVAQNGYRVTMSHGK